MANNTSIIWSLSSLDDITIPSGGSVSITFSGNEIPDKNSVTSTYLNLVPSGQPWLSGDSTRLGVFVYYTNSNNLHTHPVLCSGSSAPLVENPNEYTYCITDTSENITNSITFYIHNDTSRTIGLSGSSSFTITGNFLITNQVVDWDPETTGEVVYPLLAYRLSEQATGSLSGTNSTVTYTLVGEPLKDTNGNDLFSLNSSNGTVTFSEQLVGKGTIVYSIKATVIAIGYPKRYSVKTFNIDVKDALLTRRVDGGTYTYEETTTQDSSRTYTTTENSSDVSVSNGAVSYETRSPEESEIIPVYVHWNYDNADHIESYPKTKHTTTNQKRSKYTKTTTTTPKSRTVTITQKTRRTGTRTVTVQRTKTETYYLYSGTLVSSSDWEYSNPTYGSYTWGSYVDVDGDYTSSYGNWVNGTPSTSTEDVVSSWETTSVDVTYTYQKISSSPSGADKSGYNLTWNDEYGNSYTRTQIQEVYVTEDLYFYAVYTPKSYVVTFSKNNGTGGTNSVSIKYNTTVGGVTITPPARSGYYFKGYYTSTSNGTQYFDSDGSLCRTWDKTSNTTLYAQWGADITTLTIYNDIYTYDGNRHYIRVSGAQGFSIEYCTSTDGVNYTSWSTTRPYTISESIYVKARYANSGSSTDSDSDLDSGSSSVVNALITIIPAELEITFVNEPSKVYDGTSLYPKIIISGKPENGASVTGTIKYGTTSSSLTNSIPYDSSTNVISLSEVSVTNYNNGSGNSVNCYVKFTPSNQNMYSIATNSSTYTISGKGTVPTPIVESTYVDVYDGNTYYAKARASATNIAGSLKYGINTPPNTSGNTASLTISSTLKNMTSYGRKDVGSTTLYVQHKPTDTANWNSSLWGVASVTIANKKVCPTITFNNQTRSVNWSVSNQGSSPLQASALTISGGNGSSFSYSIISYGSSISEANKSKISINNNGVITVTPGFPIGRHTITVKATQSANTNYESGSATAVITVNLSKGSQTPSLTTSPSDRTLTYPNNGYMTVSNYVGTLTTSSDNTSVVTVNINSSNSSKIDVTSVNPGTANISIYTSGNDYIYGEYVTLPWTVNKKTATIDLSNWTVNATCASDGSGSAVYTTSFAAPTGSNSGIYSYVDMTNGWEINPDTRTIKIPANTNPAYSPFTLRVRATALSNSEYESTTTTASTDGIITVNLVKAEQEIEFSPNPVIMTYGDDPVVVDVTGVGSLSAPTSSNSNICTAVANNGGRSITVTAVGEGQARLTVNRIASTYVYGKTETLDVIVNPGDPPPISYTTGSSYSIYCVETATSASALSANRTLTISSAGATSTTGTITCSIKKSDGSTLTGWSVNSSGKSITIPSGTTSGTYNVIVTATATLANHRNNSVSKSISIEIKENKLSSISISITDSDKTISVGETTGLSTVATYTNGKQKSVTATYTHTDTKTYSYHTGNVISIS